MRHSAHIMFGQNFTQTIQEVKKYIQKYGENQHSPYFKSMLWFTDNQDNIVLSPVELEDENTDSFMNGLDNKYQLKLSKAAFNPSIGEEDLIRYFTTLQQNTINLDNQSSHSQLHYCLYFPLYDRDVWNNVQNCISILSALQLPIEIDLFGLGYDLAELFTDVESIDIKTFQKTTNDTIKKALEIKKNPNSKITHFIVMQNCQSKGISLNLSSKTLVKIIGEFALLCIESYDAMFTLVHSNSEMQALGLSVLNLDKYYYVEYLLHKTYLFALEREGIKGVNEIEDVDVVMATNKAQEILKNKIHILSEFFNNEIKTRLSNRKSHEIIIEEITPILKNKMAELASDFEAFIIDKKLSIPAKRAIFSALLGEDDELFDNKIFTEAPLWLDDIDAEAFQVYINANNALLNTEKQKNEAVLSEDENPVNSPLSEIRKLRTEILQTTGYIRKLEKEVEVLSQQVGDIEESKKSLLDDGFYEFGGTNYQLLPKIDEKPLEEDYISHEVKSTVVDLRSGFTAIKNQGQTGACTAFSLTSIYEYILKSNKQEEFDLSEAFLFYNARKKSGDENKLTGSRIDYAIESLVEDGICLEEKWTNRNGSEKEIQTFYTTEPSPEAKSDALLRRVKKAVNVKRTIDDIKSALEDGYPIEISTTLFDSFGNDPSGVISYPTEEEILSARTANINRGHAMVICGFSDEDKLFVVRNSWGTDFGDNGYCYLPYSYVTNDELTSYAAAIIEVATFSAQGVVKRTSLPFGDDVKMRYAIKKNALEEERRLLADVKENYTKLKLQYNELHESIINPHIQNNLTKSTFNRQTNEIHVLRENYNNACVDMDEKLSVLDRLTKRKSIRIALSFVFIIIFEILYCFLFKKGLTEGWWNSRHNVFSWLYNNEFIIISSFLVIGFVATGLYLQLRIKKRKKLKKELQEICDDCNRKVVEKEKELKENKLSMHFADMILSENSKIEHKLSKKYQFMQSFFVNMNTWHTKETNSLKTIDGQLQAPFISIISNETLDQYFDDKRVELTKNISLCNIFVDNYQLSKEGISKFQDTLKRNFCNELLASLDDFSIYNYFANPGDKLFLNNKPPKKLLPELETKSDVFVRHSKLPNTSKNIFIYTRDEDESHNWQSISRSHFSCSPSHNTIISPLKLVMTQLEELTINDLYL